MSTSDPCFILPWIREWSTCWESINFLYRFCTREWLTCWDANAYALLYGNREWSTCWYSINMFFHVWLGSGQRVETLPMFSIALDSRVVNMLRFYEYVLLFVIREWSACWYSITMFFHLGLESGQRVETLPMFPIALDSRVVNMLRIYEYVLSSWIWEWSTCWY